MFTLDWALCVDCRSLAAAILTPSVSPQNGWRTIQSSNSTLTYLEKHGGNNFGSLKTSASSGCKLCGLIVEVLLRQVNFQSASTYFVFIWGRVPLKCEVKIGTGEISRFTEHISNWQQPPTLVFSKRNAVGSDSVILHETSPLLSILPDQDPGSEQAFNRVRKWMEDCLRHHQACVRPRSTLPKRVLDLGKANDLSNIALYLSNGEDAPYATLSYSWGGKGERLKTKTDSLQERCQGIRFDAFPKTLRDGVRIAKRLGFRYLWIDSLCIIQDDNNDWVQEGRAMTETYGRSTLNISASSSTRSDEGFLDTLPNHGVGIGVCYASDSDEPHMIFAGAPLQILDLERKEVSARGWIFQERLVSPNTLHYTNEGMIWECGNGIVLEHDQTFTSVGWKTSWKDVIRKDSIPQEVRDIFSGSCMATESDFRSWNEWMCAYSDRELFKWTDKFPAIAGVAKTFATAFNTTYCAGLWKENLIAGLLWRRHNVKTTLGRSSEFIAPSWSWASVNGRLEYRNVQLTPFDPYQDLKIIDSCAIEKTPGSYGISYGIIRSGYISAKGVLQPVMIDRQFHPGVRQKPHQECGFAAGFMNTTNVLCMLDEFHETDPRYHECWCLRIASFNASGRKGDMFLVLDSVRPGSQEYRRIGLAETDAWANVSAETPNSGFFTSGRRATLTLI